MPNARLPHSNPNSEPIILPHNFLFLLENLSVGDSTYQSLPCLVFLSAVGFFSPAGQQCCCTADTISTI
jgi:hypothetical protein